MYNIAMKKYSVVALFIVVLITIAVSSYFFFLDITHDNKLVKEEVDALQSLKSTINTPVAEYLTNNDLQAKSAEYRDILEELGIKGSCHTEKEVLIIEGVIEDSESYVLMKRLLAVVKNDNVTLLASCIGKGCVSSDYGYKIIIRPYRLNFSR